MTPDEDKINVCEGGVFIYVCSRFDWIAGSNRRRCNAKLEMCLVSG